MSSITITKTQYEALKSRAVAYDRIIAVARDDIFSPPPTRNRKVVMSDFRATKKYSAAFLKSSKRASRARRTSRIANWCPEVKPPKFHSRNKVNFSTQGS